MIDYRKILSVYMKAVVNAESVTFVTWVPHEALTEAEHAALKQIEEELPED